MTHRKLIALCLSLLFSKVAYSQVKIGTNVNTIDTNAILELESIKKGVLLPRLSLAATNSPIPLGAFKAGMLVYNIATSGTYPYSVVPGIYVSDGTRWERIINSTGAQAVIDVFGLSDSLSSPNNFSTGTFLPDTSQNPDFLYLNVSDGSLWTYINNTYVKAMSMTPSTEWYLANSSVDAGSNKTSSIYRSGRVGIGTSNPQGVLDLSKGNGTFIPPSMTTSKRDSLVSPPTGSVIFNSTSKQLQVNIGTSSSPFWSTSSDRIVSNVGPNTTVTMDNLKIQLVANGTGFQLGTVSGTMSVRVNGWTSYGASGSNNWWSQQANATLTTTYAHPGTGWGAEVNGNVAKVFVRDLTNNKFYEITISFNGTGTGSSFTNSIIEIRRIY